MKITLTMPETTVLAELGERAQRYRVDMNLTQAELAKKAGVSQRTIERFEGGSSVQLETLLRILRTLQLSANLDQLVPEANIRPIQLASSKTEVRHRSNKRRNTSPKGAGWVWGDKK
ncbi:MULTISPECIES: helix-turn-helix transcriptional regulator [unclassified Beijerinckia]|uniref:helix-turn-helix domain-containing protein n=1 Tax=unclassified Beijerinckia TaxID=2638183 RepID=UPI00089797B7|nr:MULTISPECIES: helix-turn-helix transcriptional regulator [unclassified Beijerinckia]MDH7798851.1 transcriptional regulator with XRE-family HTH domain [Beijerinckia sp. GAS462]SED89000.1 Helix-turn-helix [Beijerinckia sp. 28-YEA-48]